MSIKLYVGNLSFRTTEEELRELFEESGTVESASVVEDRITGRSKGFGFVEMTMAEEARAAIDQFNGKEVDGRALTVNEAKPRERSGGRLMRGERVGIYESSLAPVIEERTVEGPEPIERTAYLESQPIAVAYLDEPKTEATVAWPLSEGIPLADVLEACLNDFFPRYAGENSNYTLEFWIDDHYYESPLESNSTTLSVLERIEDVGMTDSGSMRLLQIASGDAVVELLFDDNDPPGPMRLAVLISVVRADVLARFFTRFHRNDVVRNDVRVAERLFAPRRPRIQPSFQNFQSFLFPLRTYSERHYGFGQKSGVPTTSFSVEE